MSATNVYRDTTAADLLNNERMKLLSQITPSGSGANNFTPDYVLPVSDIFDITDSVTLNGGLQSPADTLDITDSVTEIDYPGGSSNLAGQPSFKKLWLQMNGDVIDQSTNGNNGTVTGTTTFADAVIGKGFSFNGSTNISCGDITALHSITQMSVFAWVNTSSLAAQQAILTKWQHQTQDSFAIELLTTGFIKVTIGNAVNDAGGNTGTATNLALSTNTWYRVGFVYDGTQSTNAGKLTIYVNGVAASVTFTGTIPSSLNSGTAAVIVGEFSGSLTRFFSGKMDDVQIWNYALSSTEVAYDFAKKDGWQVVDDSSYQKLWMPFDLDYLDKSGNANNGTLTGNEAYVPGAVTYVDQRLNKAVSLDGVTYYTIANESQFDFERTNPFSVACWVKGTNVGNREVIVSKMNTVNTTGYCLNFSTGNNLIFRLINTNGTNDINVAYTTNLRDGNWHHIVVTYDGSSSASGVLFYIDGTLATPTITTNNLSATILNGINVVVGAFADGTNPITGSIDDVRIWNIVLSLAQVQTLMGGQGLAYNPLSPIPAICDFMECVA